MPPKTPATVAKDDLDNLLTSARRFNASHPARNPNADSLEPLLQNMHLSPAAPPSSNLYNRRMQARIESLAKEEERETNERLDTALEKYQAAETALEEHYALEAALLARPLPENLRPRRRAPAVPSDFARAEALLGLLDEPIGIPQRLSRHNVTALDRGKAIPGAFPLASGHQQTRRSTSNLSHVANAGEASPPIATHPPTRKNQQAAHPAKQIPIIAAVTSPTTTHPPTRKHQQADHPAKQIPIIAAVTSPTTTQPPTRNDQQAAHPAKPIPPTAAVTSPTITAAPTHKHHHKHHSLSHSHSSRPAPNALDTWTNITLDRSGATLRTVSGTGPAERVGHGRSYPNIPRVDEPAEKVTAEKVRALEGEGREVVEEEEAGSDGEEWLLVG